MTKRRTLSGVGDQAAVSAAGMMGQGKAKAPASPLLAGPRERVTKAGCQCSQACTRDATCCECIRYENANLRFVLHTIVTEMDEGWQPNGWNGSEERAAAVRVLSSA